MRRGLGDVRGYEPHSGVLVSQPSAVSTRSGLDDDSKRLHASYRACVQWRLRQRYRPRGRPASYTLRQGRLKQERLARHVPPAGLHSPHLRSGFIRLPLAHRYVVEKASVKDSGAFARSSPGACTSCTSTALSRARAL